MNTREEDRKKSNCTGRGLGFAAAAIGVGVGAALYYIFSQRPENPGGQGSTTSWNCEQTPLESREENSFITMSEHSTSDTSLWSDSEFDLSEINDTTNSGNETPVETDEFENQVDCSDGISDDNDGYDAISNNSSFFDSFLASQLNIAMSNEGSDTEEEWEISPMPSPDIYPSREEQQAAARRQEAFRERAWSLEECAICFEVMLQNQELMSLPCTHNFHAQCIMPWLQERQTCPCCRKTA